MRENRTCSLSGGRWPARKRATSDPTPTKCPNDSGKPPAEGMEGRRPTKENIGQATAPRTQSRTSASSDLLDVREATLRRQVSEVGAVCSNAARTDLCGGRWVNQRPYRDKAIRWPWPGCSTRPGKPGYSLSSSSNAFASFKSAVSKPSVNQP